MSFASEYGKLRKKRLEEAEETAKSPTDIAPVSVPEETSAAEESGSKEFLGGYLKAGVFDDGYQFGDLLRGGAATITDTIVGIGKGAMQSMEGVTDFILHGAAEGLKMIGKNNGEGADWLSMELESLAKHDTAGLVAGGVEDTLETVGIGESESFIGEKGQGLPEAVGQVWAMVGTAQWLKAAGYGDKAINAITTALNYFSSTGSGISEAKNAGATEGEAWTYGTLKGAVDAGTERLFGGLGKAIPVVGISKGILSLDDRFAKLVSSKISNQLVKNFVEYGIKASAEGFEEVLAGLGTAAIKKFTYMSGEDLQKLVEDENLLDQFIAGMVASGIAQSGYVPGMSEGSLREANKAGRDFISGLTKNETKVADHEYKKRVEAEEADGKKLTNKEKDKIYNDVLEDVKKGYISTDTIEEVLGGDSYKSYMDSIDSDNAAIKELEGVYEGEEFEAAKKDILDNSKRTELKKKLSEDVLGQTVSGKDSYLTNSYLEVEKRGQAFEADLESYTSDSAKQTIQNIIDSGVANNTGRMHELANLLAKISEDKGIVFSVTDAKRLAQTSYAVDGKAVNGYITEDGITINIDSKKYLNSVVGHEITHALEGTDFYDVLQQTVFEYAMAKGEYNDRLRKARELYKGVEGYKGADGFSKIKKEVAADLVGEYLFDDPKFIANLSTKNRNLFQKLFDEIKYLYKIATAGSKEKRQLERVKKAFEDAYRGESKATEDTKYSLESVEGADTSSNEIGLHDAKDITDMHTGYENVPDALLGFRKNGYSKEYEAQNYPYNLKLWVSVDGGYHFFKDEIKGMNYNHALERAYRNWDDGVFRLREDVGAKQAGSKEKRQLERVKKAFEDAYRADSKGSDTSPNTSEQENEKLNSIGLEYDSDSETVSFSLSSLEDSFNYHIDENGVLLTEDDYQRARDEYVNALAKSIALDKGNPTAEEKAKASKYLDGLFLIHDMIAADKDRLDYEAAVGKSSWVSNSEYGGSIDFSTLCAKRRLFTGTFDAIQNALPDTVLNENDFLTIRDMLLEKGLESPCSMCYVEGSRAKHGEYVAKWLKEYLATDPAWKPQIADFTSSTRLERTRIEHPEAYAEYQKAMNKLAQRKPKEASVRTDYRGEILVEFEDGSSVEVKNNNGGIRFNSFSDFEIIHALDCMQVITDMARVGLNGQAYTKVKEFAESFGGTGLKINLSLVAKDVDQNGRLVMDEVNGMKYDEAMEIRDKYSDNVGTVIVVFNDEQLKAALADSTIDYVLPFHRSQWKKSQYNLMGLPGVTKDYTALQNDRVTNPNTGRPVKLGKLKQTTTYTNDITGETYTIKDNIMPNMYWDYSKNGRENANRYLDYINANQMTPKFDFLLEKSDGKWVLPEGAVGDGYFKLLIDFKMYNNEGWGAPQNPVVPEFNMPYIQEMLENYVGGHQAFPVAQDVVDEFVKKKKSGTVQSTKALPKSQPIRSNLSLPGISPATMSLSEEDISPVKRGKYGITSEEVKLQIGPNNVTTVSDMEKVAPVQEEGSATEAPRVTMDDIAPVIEKAPKEAYDSGNVPTFETANKEQIKGQQTMFKEPVTEKTIKTVKDRLEHKLRASYDELSHNEKLRREAIKGFNDKIDSLQYEYDNKKNHNTKAANDILRRIERLKRLRDDVEADYTKRINDNRAAVERRKAAFEEGYSTEEGRAMRTDLHTQKVEEIKNAFAENGLDFDDVLKNAKDLSTLSTVDNTPQRVMEKSLGYKEGQVLADLTVNKVAQNETEGIKWLNTVTSRSGEGGLLKQLSKKYHIKPGSKESAAAQMFAEGFYVNDKGETITYGSEELAKDFPNKEVQKNIKGLATDSRIRRFYDDTLTMINESRARNAYPEIKPLDNYFLHFRAMDDTFSRLGIPFNPNDIKAKDLPTDLNGVTADLKPGQPYFSSAMHRRGNKTTYDLLGGMERYASGAKNQIYHIDDIQTLRALRNYIADTYGQANGLENLDNLSEEEVQDRIKQVYNSHLSTFAKFLNEEANVIAGKTALIDRGLEGIIGRRGITFLDTVNKQVGSNMVGFNVSSSLTNLLATTQAFAKTNKTAFVKGFAQTMANKVGHLFGKADSFADNPTAIRRKGADRFYRTPWQKTADAGYAFMGAVDNVATEIIVRSKYNEFIKKGMSEQQAITEADKWASRLMGDRSLGQMPQLYNSKMLGLFTKFQLEVRNQLDSQFYDTIQETKASNKDIENGLKRNAKTAAKVAATFAELAIAQHIFGKVFESIAGYNPAFDIIDVLIKTFGFDDEEDSEDTALDNVEQGFLALLEDLPYTSTLTGGRVPIASALPVEELVTGKDEYGNEKSRLDTLKEIAHYIVSPTGYGQVKKTIQGLSMFDDDLPVAGSYTDSGNLRFPVEDTIENRIQAGVFGQWANENAGYYFDNNISPLKEKQIKEYIEVDMPIEDYWKYRKGLSKYGTLAEKADYINSLDLTLEQKNILINNLANRKEAIDMTDYDEYESFAELDFAEKYPEKYTVAKALGGYESYKKYSSELYDIKADKDADGKTVSDSRKKKVVQYVNSLDIDYGAKLILYKSEYKSDDRYNYEIVDYLNSREDISYEEMATILQELGFTVDSKGNISWD